METEENSYPTIGSENGVTVAGTSPDDFGNVDFGGTESSDELLEIGGFKELSYREKVERALPEKAELLDNDRLKVRNNREKTGYDRLNKKRRAILRRLDDGEEPLDIVDSLGFNDSYVYRARSVFGFLLEDELLKEAFIDDGGEFAPTYNPKEEEEESEEEKMSPEEYAETKRQMNEEQTIPVEEAREMAEEAYQNGLEDAEEGESDSFFDGDEWWEIMKALMEAGKDDYARRIASEIDFD